MKILDMAIRTSVAALIAGLVVIGVRSTDAARPQDVSSPVTTAAASPVDAAGPLSTPAPTPATVDQLIAANPALASLPRADLQYRLDHPVQTAPPRLGAEALQARMQAGMYTYPDGMPAIQPTLQVRAGDLTTAAFDAETVMRYFANNVTRYWTAGAPGAGKVLRVVFTTEAQAKALHPMLDSIRPNDAVICYVELAGPALRDQYDPPPSDTASTGTPTRFYNRVSSPAELASTPSATYVFDGQTGNELVMF